MLHGGELFQRRRADLLRRRIRRGQFGVSALELLHAGRAGRAVFVTVPPRTPETGFVPLGIPLLDRVRGAGRTATHPPAHIWISCTWAGGAAAATPSAFVIELSSVFLLISRMMPETDIGV